MPQKDDFGRYLQTVALNDYEGVFQMLINGADPSLLPPSLDIDERNNDGVTPLMTADDFCRQIAFEMLIQNGADPSLKHNNGFSLLDFAAQGK